MSRIKRQKRNIRDKQKSLNSRNAPIGDRYHRVSTAHEEVYYEEEAKIWWKILLRFSFGILLLLPCVALTLHIWNQLGDGNLFLSIWENPLSLSFLAGVAFCLIFHIFGFMRALFLPVYVFGHEVTHAIFVFFCYGKVSGFKADVNGGYIIANRSNILVSLSPYIFPFWTLVVGLLFLISGTLFDITPYLTFYSILFGATWAFNLAWTIFMIPLGQSDLKNNGTFLSLIVIFLSNALMLSLLLKCANVNLSFAQWFYSLLNKHMDVLEWLYSFKERAINVIS